MTSPESLKGSLWVLPTGFELSQDQRSTKHGHILPEHRLLDVDGVGIVQSPECMHAEGHGHEKRDQHPSTPS